MSTCMGMLPKSGYPIEYITFDVNINSRSALRTRCFDLAQSIYQVTCTHIHITEKYAAFKLCLLYVHHVQSLVLQKMGRRRVTGVKVDTG